MTLFITVCCGTQWITQESSQDMLLKAVSNHYAPWWSVIRIQSSLPQPMFSSCSGKPFFFLSTCHLPTSSVQPYHPLGFPGCSDGKEFACNAGDTGSIPGSGRSPGEGNGNPFQYFCLENPRDRGAWWATVHGVTKNPTRLSD